MKIFIGPYKNFLGPYQLARYILFFIPRVKDKHGFKEDHPVVHRFGHWLAEDKNGKDSWITNVCNWFHSKEKRTVRVKLHKYDTWSMDSTLSHIIHPMLVQLKATKHGAPFVDDEDVPEHLRSTVVPLSEEERMNGSVDENHFKRWDWVLDEMIWAFGELMNDKPGEDTFYDHSACKKTDDVNEMIENLKVDREGLDAYHKRMQKAFLMFGKYYGSLWD
jgi:hypothetical protein